MRTYTFSLAPAPLVVRDPRALLADSRSVGDRRPCVLRAVLVAVLAVSAAAFDLSGTRLTYKNHPPTPNVLGMRDGLKVVRIEASPMEAPALSLVAGFWLVARVVKLEAILDRATDAFIGVDVDGNEPSLFVAGTGIPSSIHGQHIEPAAGISDFSVLEQSLPDSRKRNAAGILSLSHLTLQRSFWLGSRAVSSSAAARFHFSAEVSA